MTGCVLGVDVGTTAIKAALFDTAGNEVASRSEEYSLLTPQAGHVELAPATYTTTFATVIRRLLADGACAHEDISVLGLSAQGETFVCLDAHNEPIGNALVWMDNRATAEAEEIERHFGREVINSVTGQIAMDAIWPASKILWIKRNEPELFARTAKFALLKDYLVYQLTGKLVSEDSLLCSTILWDINTRRYWPEMLEFLGVQESQLPEIARQGEIVGSLTDTAAVVFGLSTGMPVSVGALDQACGALGVGNAVPGIFSESTGSALTSVTIVEELTVDASGRVPCFPAAVPGQYMLHTFSTGGMVMRWYRDEFCASERRIEELCGINAYYLIDKEVQQVAPGSDGLIVLPHLQGSGPPDMDPYARGVIFGLTLAHKKQHLSRGIMEGVTMVLRRMIDATSELGVEISEIISLSGGSKSAAWCQIKADATQLPVRTLHGAESAACRGAALIAGANVGIWESIAPIARKKVETDRLYEPLTENARAYDQLFDRFMLLSKSLKPLYVTDEDQS